MGNTTEFLLEWVLTLELQPVLKNVKVGFRHDHKHVAARLVRGAVFIDEDRNDFFVFFKLLDSLNLRVFAPINKIPQSDCVLTGNKQLVVVVVQNHL